MTHTAISTIIVLAALLAFSGLSLKIPGPHERSRCMAAFAAATVATMYWIANRDWGLGLSTALLASILATQLAFAVCHRSKCLRVVRGRRLNCSDHLALELS